MAHPSLRQEEADEDGHNQHEGGEEEKEEELHVTQHGEEDLGNDEGEEHVRHPIYTWFPEGGSR